MKKYRKMLVVFVVGIFLLSGMLTGAVAIKINHAQKLPNQPNIKKTLRLREFLLRVIELLFERIKNLKGLGDENNDDDNDDNIISMDTCLVDLPSTSVLADMIEIWGAAPLYSYLSVELSGIIGSYDVENKIYPGWCIDYHTPLPFGPPMPIPVMLYSSYCPPGDLIDDGWEEVNHILNNKHPSATWNDIHVAITQFVNFGDPVAAPDPSSIAGQMVSAASANPTFIPQPGDVVAVIVDPMEEEIGIFPIENEWGCHDRWQYTIIEVPLPDEPYEGRTPGFWKNKGLREDLWPDEYSPTETICYAFSVPSKYQDFNKDSECDTLIEALNYIGKGGKEEDKDSGMARILLRAAVAALLNAAHDEVNYPLTVVQVVNQVDSALASGNPDTMETLKDELDGYNNLGSDDWW